MLTKINFVAHSIGSFNGDFKAFYSVCKLTQNILEDFYYTSAFPQIRMFIRLLFYRLLSELFRNDSKFWYVTEPNLQ